MTWFKVDDGFWSHPKTSTLSPAAVALWVRAGSYSSQHLTDGEVPKASLRLLGKPAAARELVSAGLWQITDDGWRFHDWSEYQETSEVVRKRRDDARDRQRKARAARENKRGESHEKSRVTEEVTSTVTNGVSSLPPTRPDPTRPDLYLLVTKEGRVTVRSARATAPQPLDARSTSTTTTRRPAGRALTRDATARPGTPHRPSGKPKLADATSRREPPPRPPRSTPAPCATTAATSASASAITTPTRSSATAPAPSVSEPRSLPPRLREVAAMSDRETAAQRRHEAAEERRSAIAACGACDPNGWLIVGDKAVRCDHGAEEARR